jgi:hypothetical protein
MSAQTEHVAVGFEWLVISLMPRLRVDHYLLYELTFKRDGRERLYVGITGVLEGQTDAAALLARRKNHRERLQNPIEQKSLGETLYLARNPGGQECHPTIGVQEKRISRFACLASKT